MQQDSSQQYRLRILPDAMPYKTAMGQEEIRHRSRTLSQRQRTVLLLINGQRTVSEIRDVAARVGAPDTCFDELVSLGLVGMPEPAPEPAPTVATEPTPMLAEALPIADPLPESPETVRAPEVASDAMAQATAEVDPEPVIDAPGDVSLDVQSFDDPEPNLPPEPPHAQWPIEPPDLGGHLPALAERDASDSDAERLGGLYTEDLAPSEVESDLRRQALHGDANSSWLDSVKSSLMPIFESALGPLDPPVEDEAPGADPALAEARRVLMREVRQKSPITGALTLRKLRRATTREEIVALLDEVAAHISQPMRQLSAQQVLTRVRGLLEAPRDAA